MGRKKAEPTLDLDKLETATDKDQVAAPAHPKSLKVAVAAAKEACVSMDLVEGKRPVLRQWIQEKWPGYTFADGSLNATVSTLYSTRTRTPKNAEPVDMDKMRSDMLSAMLAVNAYLAEKKESPSEFKAVVEKINGLAEKLGGLSGLVQFLDSMTAAAAK